MKSNSNVENYSPKSKTEIFIEKARKVHGDKYDYSKVVYKKAIDNVIIICKEHGEFLQTPHMHLRGQGCPKCAKNVRLTTEEFIECAREIHGDKYDYSKVNYVNNKTKVKIICPEHGEFWQTPNKHIYAEECCPKCNGGVRMTKEEFIERAREIHGDKYDYSKVEYKNARTDVCIICPIHGEFWQVPYVHIGMGCGCPSCNSSKLEDDVSKIFPDFIRQQTFDWLKYKLSLSLDFYSPDLNIAIECQGEQHFRSVDYFGGDKKFEDIQQRDLHKFQLCQSHNIKVLYYFPSDYTPTEFYSDKLCFHTIDDIKSYINLLSL